MQKKEILIIATIVALAAGLVIFLHFTNPEVLTQNPREVIFGEAEREQKEQAEPTDLPTTNFIVADEYWDSATFLLWEGELRKNNIHFLDIPVGTKIYAPVSGYLMVTSTKAEEGYYSGFTIREDANWSESGEGTLVVFIMKGFNLLDIGSRNGHPFVEKGKAFAEVTDNTKLFPEHYAQTPRLIVALSKKLVSMVDDSITDPREYIKKAVEKIN